MLRIHIVEAKNLMKKDISVLGKGKSDPYAIVTVGAQTFRTQTIDNTVNPKWDYWCEVRALKKKTNCPIISKHEMVCFCGCCYFVAIYLESGFWQKIVCSEGYYRTLSRFKMEMCSLGKKTFVFAGLWKRVFVFNIYCFVFGFFMNFVFLRSSYPTTA